VYDFYFGSPAEIAADETKYLVAIKRMMPRWINSIPDSEFLALAQLLDEQGAAANSERPFVAVETGAGASSLAMAFYAMKYDGIAYSWDMNGAKGSEIRRVCNETMGNYFHKHVDDHWKLVAYDSLSPHLGLPVLRDLVDHVDLFFHDSEHVWRTVEGELERVLPMLRDGAVVALDDANQDYLHTNVGYVNTFRRKLGLPPIPPVEGNATEPFYVQTERLLQQHWGRVEHLPDLYKERVHSDPYFAYYDAEFEIKADLGTERIESLEHRFDSWRVSERCA
jgi:predicted O-methyltransferase YrrM